MTTDNKIRLTTGVPGLDELLGGGLIPGTLTVVMGSTGIGKTQLGIQFAGNIHPVGVRRGILFDMCARGDSQNHAEYAQRICRWELETAPAESTENFSDFFKSQPHYGDYLRIFQYQGRRVTRGDLDFDAWHDWQAELNIRLGAAIAFFYGNFGQGVTRVVVDGIEPVDRSSDSIQLHLFEYIYHQILRKDPDWVARDLFRQHYRQYAEEAATRRYDPTKIACLLLCTSRETMLDELIARPIEQGDVLSNANTIILMGKQHDGSRLGRALYVAKHRGSACTDEIVPYHIDDQGIRIRS